LALTGKEVQAFDAVRAYAGYTENGFASRESSTASKCMWAYE
jgi:hypothetical protein